MANQTLKLTVGGPVQVESGTYLTRPADEQLLAACQAGTFAYVLACRQIGKSSLMFETSEKLAQAGVRTAVIDLNTIGHSVEAESWYFSFIDELARRLNLQMDVQTWWDTRPRLSTFIQRFLQFLREVVLKEISESVVVFVDEIDMTLGLGFTDDFFAAIRSVYHERAYCPDFQRLTFVLLGVATPDELIADQARTPFNIGQAITLRDFTKEECDPFRLELESRYPDLGRQLFDQVYEWTRGHPYLTQKLCAAILRERVPDARMSVPTFVQALVRMLFWAPEARSEDNIQFVQNRVTGDPYSQEMLKTYKRILEGEKPVYDDDQSPPVNRLKLYGLVAVQAGKLEVRNQLYARAFDVSWADEMLRLSSTSVRLGLPDRYKILQEIGQGGFSTVYLAQVTDLDRTQSVALKVLKSDVADNGDRLERFKQEARAVAKLEHPNIIRILDTGGDGDTSFIVMEYVAGGTVRDRLKTSPLSRNEAMQIVRDIGNALTYAHQHGIIHRDVNPNNILLDTTYKPIRPVLTDFGLIKVLSGDGQPRIQSTTILGTLEYMAPEQWRQESPTPATDVYALALTFFEMLSARRPFAASTFLELMNKHVHEPLPALSSVMPELGPFFDAVLLRAAAKQPSDRFDSIASFIAALEGANAQAEEAQRSKQQQQAAQIVEATRNYIRKGHYEPDRALAMVEAALEICPGDADALRLRGQIRAQHEQIERALEDFRQAYEQVADPSSDIGAEYLETLSQIAEGYWQRQMYQAAAERFETVRQILDGGECPDESIRQLWQHALSRLIEYHYQMGQAAYADGVPESIEDALNILEGNVGALASLKAERESQDLRAKLRQLQVKKYQTIIADAERSIRNLNAGDSSDRFGRDDIFLHYLAMDEAYQALMAWEPEDKEWPAKRRAKLKEQAESHYLFAIRAAERLDPDYEAALRHYKAIQDIEAARYPGIAQELKLDLTEKIRELQEKTNYDGKYNEIMKLVESKDYPKALERIDYEFIQAGNYEHRDVARWFWCLIYAKQHDGSLPPEWESMSGFDTLSKRLIRMERARIQQLKDKLEPWSQARILETIRNETRLLSTYEEHVESIEALLREVATPSLAESPEVGTCRDELIAVRERVEGQRSAFFEIDMHETDRKVEGWLQRIEDIEALLQTGNPIKDIPEFLNRADVEQQAIESDPTFEMLQELRTANARVKHIIENAENTIRERLLPVLIQDVDHRDRELAELREESTRLQKGLSEALAEASAKQKSLAQAQAEIDTLRQQASSTKQLPARTRKQHEINKYVIPFSLLLALFAGGLIAPQIARLPDLDIIKWIALVLLVAYFVYYIWAYFPSD